MNAVILRVKNNPKSSSTWLCYVQGLKTIVLSKSKLRNVKPNKLYVVDLIGSPYADGTKFYVRSVINRGELLTKVTATKKKAKAK